jgi:hypothetical protein
VECPLDGQENEPQLINGAKPAFSV